jgi:hypothetical protein
MRRSFFGAGVAALLLLVMGTASASERHEPPAAILSFPDDLNMPGDFQRRIADRAVIDAFQANYHRVESDARPTPRKLFAARSSAERFIAVVHSRPDPDANQHRSQIPDSFVPLRSYRAPILGRANEMPPAFALHGELSQKEITAAEYVARRLAHDGLLTTLARVIEILGPDRFTTEVTAGLGTLQSVGIPTDLLACFSGTNGDTINAPINMVAFIAQRIAGGATLESLAPELGRLPFKYALTHQPFRVATESGEDELGMLRVQVGGGYDHGIVAGGSIDVICQLVSALPDVDFLISIPSPHLEPFHQLASQAWRLRRTNHVTLISEPLNVGAWAQDNGKAGHFTAESSPGPGIGSGRQPPATLVPRYACVGEGQSSFQKGESFLMDGLRTAGHAVAQSPMLFQGGNLLAVRDPKSGQRLLLVGEAELYRNMALGLTRSQVLEAFQAEFGVDRCVPVPSASYHLDFDVCLRARGGVLVAFVNDTMSAARTVVGLGLDALEKSGALIASAAQACRADLGSGRDLELVRRLRIVIPRRSPAGAGYPPLLSRQFASGRTDSTTGNFQCFLLALGLLESSLEEAGHLLADSDPEHTAYLQALRRMNAARRAQIEVFASQGWKVISIPSMTDLYRSINYLNGIHHRRGYLMPAFGGFYTPMDDAAMAAFREEFGSEFKITPILSAECQQHHGGVHCAAMAYPKL